MLSVMNMEFSANFNFEDDLFNLKLGHNLQRNGWPNLIKTHIQYNLKTILSLINIVLLQNFNFEGDLFNLKLWPIIQQNGWPKWIGKHTA